MTPCADDGSEPPILDPVDPVDPDAVYFAALRQKLEDRVIKQLEDRVNSAGVTPVWGFAMLDAGLVVPEHENKIHALLEDNKLLQFLKRRREQRGESSQKKRKTETATDTATDTATETDYDKQSMVTAVGCTKKVIDLEHIGVASQDAHDLTEPGKKEFCEDDCKACAFEQRSPNTHVLEHTCKTPWWRDVSEESE